MEAGCCIYLAHARSWYSAERPYKVGLDARRRFKGEDARSSQQIHRHLQNYRTHFNNNTHMKNIDTYTIENSRSLFLLL